VPNCKYFLFTESERKHVSDFNNMETRAIIKYFSLEGKAPKEIHAILTETSGLHATSYATVKKWVAQRKHGDLHLVLYDPEH